MNLRKLFIMSTLVGIAVSVIYYLYSPQRVPIHYNATGAADSWAARELNLALWISIYVFIAILFINIPKIIKNTPPKFINLPHKEYWLAPERLEITSGLMAEFYYKMGIGLNVFFMVLSTAAFKTGFEQGCCLNMGFMNIFLALFCGYTFFGLIALMRKFRKR